MSDFSLHPDFDRKIPIGSLPLCEVFLEPNRHYPWMILVPRIAGASRLLDLETALSARLWQELHLAQELVWSLQPLTQLNVGQLGNRCPQLHLHVVGRREDDPAWPNPVWGHPAFQDYPPDELLLITQHLQQGLAARCDRFHPASRQSTPCSCTTATLK